MKTKKIIAAVFAFAIAAANLSATAFAAEETPTEAATEAAATDVTEISKATETAESTETTETTETSETTVTEKETENNTETDENAETTTEPEEVDGAANDTTITEDAPVFIKNGETFTIGDESFTASIDFNNLQVSNSSGVVFETTLFGFLVSDIKYVTLSVNGNTLNIKSYDSSDRLLHDNYVEYNPSTGKFGDIEYSNSYEKYSFDFQGMSFYAVITRETKERISAEGWTEFDQYNYLSIYFSDDTPTSIQNKLVWVEYGRTGGFEGYEILSYISTSDDTLTIRRIVDSDDSSQDILTTYVFDKEANDFVLSGSSSDAQEVTEEMLIDKFVSEYGEEPYYKDFGDFNGDGELDAYFYLPWKQHTYFVTMDKITEVTKDHDIPGADNSPVFSYFELSDGTKFRLTSRTAGIYAGLHSWIYIDKINKDGTLSTASINGQESVDVISCSVPFGDTEFCKSIDKNTILTITESGITLKYYDGDNETVTSTNYVYDEANNAFVSSGSTNNSGNSSNGSTSSVSNSPATSDNFAVIPFTLSIALVAGAAAVVGIKNRRKQK